MPLWLAGLRWPGEPVEGRLVARPNRFLARVDLHGTLVSAHVPDPGRLEDLLVPGARVYLLPAPRSGRKTRWTVVLAESQSHPGLLVSTDSLLANEAAAGILDRGLHPHLPQGPWRREVRHGESRFDFALERNGNLAFVLEVKAVTHIRGRCGLFPDAPTTRGTRHVAHLAELARRGLGAGLLFCAREDAELVAPFAERDPKFAQALREAANSGVVLAACRLHYDTKGSWFAGTAPVALDCPT